MIFSDIVKALILDFDGVILDSTKTSIKNFQTYAAKKGYEVPTIQKLKELWGLPGEKILKTLWPELSLDRFLSEYVEEFDKPHSHVNGIPEALSMLKKSGLILAIISNREKTTLSWHLKKMEIPSDFFSYIQTPENSEFLKPDPRTFDLIIGLLKDDAGIAKKEIIYIGDTIHDLEAARRANIKFIGVLSGIAEKHNFLNAGLEENHILNSVADLLEFPGI